MSQTTREAKEERLVQALQSGNPPLADFLDWLGDRLVLRYDTSPNVDFVQACHRHASEIREALRESAPPAAPASEPPSRTQELINGIAQAINRVSGENGSNTPDFILAEYLVRCLKAFDITSRDREKWYGKSLSIGGESAQPGPSELALLEARREEARWFSRNCNLDTERDEVNAHCAELDRAIAAGKEKK